MKRPYVVILAGNPHEIAALHERITAGLPLDGRRVLVSRNVGGVFGAVVLAWAEGDTVVDQVQLLDIVRSLFGELRAKILVKGRQRNTTYHRPKPPEPDYEQEYF
jgi:hypothetical protein